MEKCHQVYEWHMGIPSKHRKKDPLSWMGFATIDDLRGFPRMVLSMNEADPFCDEGINFYRRAVKAGVNVEGKVLLGSDHGNDLHWHQRVQRCWHQLLI